MRISTVVIIVSCLLCYSIVRGAQIRGVRVQSEADARQDSEEAAVLSNDVPTSRGLSSWSDNKETTANEYEGNSASIFSIAFERLHNGPEIINKAPQVTEDANSENKNDNVLAVLFDRVYGDVHYGTLNPIIIESPTPSPDGASMSPVGGSTPAPSGSHFPSFVPTRFGAMTTPISLTMPSPTPSGSDAPSGSTLSDTGAPTSVGAPSGSDAPSGSTLSDTGAPTSVGAPSGSDAPSGSTLSDTGAPTSVGAPSGSLSPSGSTLPSYAGTDAVFL